MCPFYEFGHFQKDKGSNFVIFGDKKHPFWQVLYFQNCPFYESGQFQRAKDSNFTIYGDQKYQIWQVLYFQHCPLALYALFYVCFQGFVNLAIIEIFSTKGLARFGALYVNHH